MKASAPVDTLTEKQFQTQVVLLANMLGWKVQFHWRSFHSPAGYPDLTMVRGDRIVVAELKVGKNKLKPEQIEWLRVLRDTGKVEAFAWRPADFDKLTEVLR